MPPKQDAYYLLLDGESSGPHTLEELHLMWQEEKITLDTLYVQPGMTGCRPVNLILNKVIGFRKPGDTAPPPPLPDVDLEEAGTPFVTYAALAVGVAFLFWFFGSAMKSPPDPARALKAGVEATMTHLRVINLNDYDWREKTVALNGKPPNGYKYKLRNLKPGESVEISLTNFAGAEGDRLEPWRMTVAEVWIGDEKEGYRMFTPPPIMQGVPAPPPFQ